MTPTSSVGGRSPAPIEQIVRRAELVHRGDHREHHAQRMVGGDAQDRSQLGLQEIGPLQPEPDPAHPEERVRLRRLIEVGERLVGAGVERADHQRTSAQRLGRLAVRRLLLALIRHRRSAP